MPGRAYGNLMAAGESSKKAGRITRQGPGQKNLGPNRVSRPSPRPMIRSTGQQVKGPDKGVGGGS
jgi:hypothetical protein